MRCTEFSANSTQRQPLREHPSYFFFGGIVVFSGLKFWASSVKSGCYRMLPILVIGNPFKIFNMVVCFVPVLVIYLRQFRWIFNKGQSNQPVRLVHFLEQVYSCVTFGRKFFHGVDFRRLTSYNRIPFNGASVSSRKPANSAVRTGFVFRWKSRNCFPLLSHIADSSTVHLQSDQLFRGCA